VAAQEATVVKEVSDSDEFRGARFTRVDLSGATLRDVDLSSARILDAVLTDVELSGMITGLTVNGVEVAPLVEAELDRRYPERLELRGATPEALRRGWATVAAMWRPTLELAGRLPEATLHERVDGEWSLVETLRHLVFVTDAWFGLAVLGEPHPYHPIGLVPAFLDDPVSLGLTIATRPSYAEVLVVRQDRYDRVAAHLSKVTDDDLQAPRRSEVGYPPPTDHTVLGCLHVVMDEEWNHLQYARRDLAVLTT
jgi:hypothetical protein